MSKERIQWVDWCKGLGIILVLLGHTLRTDVSLVYIYGFHMPLFFFMSGLVCNEKKFNWSSFIKSRFNTLIIPYVFFYLLTWLYWLFVERSFRPISLQWWQPLLGMVYGAQWHGLMDHNGILWFLTCLFTTEVIFFAVSKIPRKWQQLLIVVVFAAVGTLFDFNLPWCLNIAMVALQFFWLGNNCREVLLSGEEKISKTGGLVFSIILTVIYLTLSFLLKNRVNMATNDYGNIWAFEFLAFIGVVGFVLLCKSLISNKINGGGLGRNTLVIFALHQPILRIVRFLGDKLFCSFPVETNVLYAIATDAIVIVCLIPCIIIWNRYVQPIIKKYYI